MRTSVFPVADTHSANLSSTNIRIKTKIQFALPSSAVSIYIIYNVYSSPATIRYINLVIRGSHQSFGINLTSKTRNAIIPLLFKYTLANCLKSKSPDYSVEACCSRYGSSRVEAKYCPGVRSVVWTVPATIDLPK